MIDTRRGGKRMETFPGRETIGRRMPWRKQAPGATCRGTAPLLKPPGNPSGSQSAMNSGDSGRNGLTYKRAGVDIDAGEALVRRIAPLARATRRAGAEAELGGFG